MQATLTEVVLNVTELLCLSFLDFLDFFKLCNPFRVDAVMLRIAPGCAARPRALLLDCFAVTQTISTNPKRGLTSKPRVA